MKKNILVIGSSGFIGTSLCEQLLLQKYRVTGIDIRRSPSSDLLNHFVEADYQKHGRIEGLVKKTDCIFHLSSSTIPAISNRFPEKDIDDNLKGILFLLELLRNHPEKKLIFLSSGGTVYGEALFSPIRESHETNPVCSYGVIKLAIEKYIQMYSRLYGINYLVYRLSNPYGSKQLSNNGQGLIASLIIKMRRQEKIEIWGDGSIIRDYIYIDDAISAMASGINYSGPENVFNLSSGIGYSTLQIISNIETLLNTKAKIDFIEARRFDVQKNVLDISRIKSSLNWAPLIGINQGIKKTISEKKSMEKYYCDYISESVFN